MYTSSHNRCIFIEKNCALDYPQLASNQEEADGKLIFHAADASKDYPTVIIVANDTDVFILCLAYAHKFQSIMIKSGTSKTELHDVKNLADSLGTEVCSALIGKHVFTGCDTVSAFSGRGKVSALKMIKREVNLC